MRFKSVLAAILAAVVLSIGFSTPGSAGGWERRGPPAGWGRERVVRHWVYRPRYQHRFHVHHRTDPYAYRYEPRGYYPYYSSGYWRPAHKVRRHRGYAAPRYYPSWGYKKRRYRHERWHARNHGGHPFWLW